MFMFLLSESAEVDSGGAHCTPGKTSDVHCSCSGPTWELSEGFSPVSLALHGSSFKEGYETCTEATPFHRNRVLVYKRKPTVRG